MTPTRQDMLDAIHMKIARTSQSDEGTGYYLPIMIGDVYKWINDNIQETEFREDYNQRLEDEWLYNYKPLSYQDDDCISYIFSLLSHD